MLGALLMVGMLAGASSLYAAGGEGAGGAVHTSRKYWIGKNISQAEKEFGTPTSSEQLVETGGMLVIYARKKDPVHFVFETDANGTITKAARVE
ncbi:MAG TPA: hypothetical protein VMV27_03430 [Candidatus Binataceae bacterium]|nr:hypothetical protein [Candidatus Binataceae bacterium]